MKDDAVAPTGHTVHDTTTLVQGLAEMDTVDIRGPAYAAGVRRRAALHLLVGRPQIGRHPRLRVARPSTTFAHVLTHRVMTRKEHPVDGVGASESESLIARNSLASVIEVPHEDDMMTLLIELKVLIADLPKQNTNTTTMSASKRGACVRIRCA